MKARGLRRILLQLIVMAGIVGVAWIVLQFYSEEEIAAIARSFWSWWSTLITGELAVYWNPVGAGVVLGIILLAVLAPLARLFRSRDYHAGASDYH